ncbi:hypothetical protein F5X68DRAFT_171476 [Plectosphaerella plurivora]|uniref:BZIP transcription factor n=1 Tax=Plectosphaerella plurivora TaxID=936078 RepID=A0A9P8V725_9PEZI|nr:hypothetical protein F5X68DRAFT_171476 [Plectosphaerella plurivora]
MAPKPEDTEAAARRAKKRELDRRAQRAARERTRSRIAYLEATVQAMTHQESSGRMSSLMEQLAEMTRQRDDLSRTLASIEGTVHAHREAERVTTGSVQPAGDREEPVQASWPDPKDKSMDDSFLPTDEVTMDLLTPGAIDLTPLSTGTFGLPTADFLDPMSPPAASSLQQQPYLDMESIGSPPLLIVPEPDKPCDCVSAVHAGPSTASGSIWRSANEALSGPGLLSNHTLRYEDELSEDIPIRVVLEGWDAVERSQNMPPLWRKLRRTDELQFSKCGKTERLAILRLMHTLLRYQAEPTAEQYAKLPPWYLSRPSQSLPHSSAIDFFVWPGVRERFIFSQHQYCSDFFWRVFADNFRMLWPFEFRDCYKRNMETGLFSVSPDFDGRIREISSWTMAPDFFHHFPEMYADIPVFQSIPAAPSISWPSGARQGRARGMRALEYGIGTGRGKSRLEELVADPEGDEWSRCNFV